MPFLECNASISCLIHINNIDRILNRDGIWIIIDGNGRKASMNGNWLFVEKKLQIFDQMVFKAGGTIFQASIK
jgi:hypothetical protein